MKKYSLYLLIILLLLIVIGCNKEPIKKDDNNYSKSDTFVESGDDVRSVTIIINDKNYILNLFSNETVSEFIDLLPVEFYMNELNGNEKYVYMDKSLTTNKENPHHIEKGDVMLYQDNCLVIFYKSFDTSYSYTKIGHIKDLDDLGSENVVVKIEK